MMNQYLSIERKNDQYPVNILRRGLLKHGKNLKLKEQHHGYKVSAIEMEKLKVVRKLVPTAKLVRQQDENEIQLPTTYSDSKNPDHYELTDIKRLLSFLVQQNEQSRLQQKKLKEQNEQMIQELKELKKIIEDIKVLQDEEYTREYHSFTSLYKSLLYIEEKVDDISSKTEDKRNKVHWQKLFEK
jgi:hypothetical protein